MEETGFKWTWWGDCSHTDHRAWDNVVFYTLGLTQGERARV
jgi:hypothetical protein